jgi:hypothetical protein
MEEFSVRYLSRRSISCHSIDNRFTALEPIGWEFESPRARCGMTNEEKSCTLSSLPNEGV